MQGRSTRYDPARSRWRGVRTRVVPAWRPADVPPPRVSRARRARLTADELRSRRWHSG